MVQEGAVNIKDELSAELLFGKKVRNRLPSNWRIKPISEPEFNKNKTDKIKTEDFNDRDSFNLQWLNM